MKRLVASSVVLLFCLALAAPTALAGDTAEHTGKTVTLEGKVLCAKCSLHEEGRDKCQNVLLVEKKGKQKYYYLTQNETSEEFGEVCQGTRTVRVKGVVKKQDGHTWLVASEITPIESTEG